MWKKENNLKEEVVLVSSCLAGIPCRYNGKAAPNAEVIELVESGRAIPVCPEVLGGLPTPRPAAEIVGDKVLSQEGEDFTPEFIYGAKKTLKIAEELECKKAILKSGSPSCGFKKIYDGTFTGNMKEANGIAGQLLHDNGIEIESRWYYEYYYYSIPLLSMGIYKARLIWMIIYQSYSL